MADRPDERLTPDTGRGIGPLPPPAPGRPQPEDDAPAPPPTEFLLPRGAVRPDSIRCPFCLELVESYPVGLSCGLGPPVLECRACGRVFLSLRREWRDMGRRAKVWFLFASLLCSVAVASWAAVETLFALFLVRARLPPWAVGLHAAAWAAVVLAVQRWRVVRSLRRTRSVERKPYRLPPWSPDLGWTLRFLTGAMLTSAALAWLAHVLKW